MDGADEQVDLGILPSFINDCFETRDCSLLPDHFGEESEFDTEDCWYHDSVRTLGCACCRESLNGWSIPVKVPRDSLA